MIATSHLPPGWTRFAEPLLPRDALRDDKASFLIGLLAGAEAEADPANCTRLRVLLARAGVFPEAAPPVDDRKPKTENDMDAPISLPAPTAGVNPAPSTFAIVPQRWPRCNCGHARGLHFDGGNGFLCHASVCACSQYAPRPRARRGAKNSGQPSGEASPVTGASAAPGTLTIQEHDGRTRVLTSTPATAHFNSCVCGHGHGAHDPVSRVCSVAATDTFCSCPCYRPKPDAPGTPMTRVVTEHDDPADTLAVDAPPSGDPTPEPSAASTTRGTYGTFVVGPPMNNPLPVRITYNTSVPSVTCADGMPHTSDEATASQNSPPALSPGVVEAPATPATVTCPASTCETIVFRAEDRAEGYRTFLDLLDEAFSEIDAAREVGPLKAEEEVALAGEERAIVQRFQLDTEDKVAWLTRRILEIQERQARVKATYRASMAALDGDLASLARRFCGPLEVYVRGKLTKRAKSIRVEDGRVGIRATAGRCVLDDPAELLKWAELHEPNDADPTLYTVTRKANVAECLKFAAGEVPAGCIFREPVESVYVANDIKGQDGKAAFPSINLTKIASGKPKPLPWHNEDENEEDE